MLNLVLSWEGSTLHSPSAPETGSVGRPSTTIPLKQSEDFWFCAAHFRCLPRTAVPDKGFGLRKSRELVDMDGRGSGNAFLLATVHVFPKFIPLWTGQLRSF